MVGAPAKPGRYVLSIDVVHDGVTWFEQPHRQPVLVVPHTDLPPAGERLIEEREPIRRTAGAAIPKVVHRIWLGDAPMPAAHARYGETFARHHPGWEHRVWTDDDLPSLGIGAGEQARARTHSELSNLVRYEILHRYGGVYVDTDVECRRPFDELIDGVEAFAGLELPGRVGTAVLGAVPGHPLFARAVRLARQTLGTGPHSANANGPYLVSLLIEQHRDRVTVFGADRFYPYRWDEPERATESFDDAHAVHHWAMSWWTGEKA
jgi:mannosyltransferase OCH1-like enzyme